MTGAFAVHNGSVFSVKQLFCKNAAGKPGGFLEHAMPCLPNIPALFVVRAMLVLRKVPPCPLHPLAAAKMQPGKIAVSVYARLCPFSRKKL